MRGKVVRVFHDKGYGFVRGEDGLSRFVHAHDVTPVSAFDLLRPDREVEFEPAGEEAGEGSKHNGLKARKVRLA